MVLTPSKVGIEQLKYYYLTAKSEERSRAAASVNGAAAYYAKDAPIGPGVWLRAGNLGVEAGSQVSVDQLRNYLACLDPASGAVLGRKYEAGGTYTDVLGVKRTRRTLSAYDLTLSIPKSISAAWALAPPEIRAEIEAAFMESIQAAVDYLQEHAVVSRKGAGGTERVAVPGGAPIACFTHTTSRAGDPQLHAHLLMQNRVLCADDKWRTLDGKAVYDHLYPASLISAAVLRTALSLRLGWAWREIDQRGHADLSGIPQELLDFWSKRHAAVAKAAADMIRAHEQRTGAEPTPEQRQAIWDKAAVHTRDAKQFGEPQDDHQRWSAEALAAGFSAEAILTAIDAAAVPEPDKYGRPQTLITDPDDPAATITPTTAAAVAAFTETSRSELTDAHIDAAAAAALNAHPSLVAHRHHTAAAAVVAKAHRHVADAIRSVLIGTPSDDHASYDTQRWRSAGLIAAETAAAQWLSDPAIDPALPAGDLDLAGLSPDQVHAAERLSASTANGIALIGPAGSGKTSTLSRVAAAIGHRRTFAVAPTAKAAGELGKAIGTGAETVAKALESPDLLPAGGLLIIDEAGQIATRDLAALCGHAAAKGLRLVLVGDHAQLAAITAGGMFDALTDQEVIETVALIELHRFADRAEAAATTRLRRGDPDSFDYHRRTDRITHSPAAHAAEQAAQWWEQRRSRTTVISAPTMEIVHAVNEAIAARRADLHETGDVIAAAGPYPVRTGELIITRRNARKLTTTAGRGIRNGDRWTVTGSDGHHGVTVANASDPDETAELPASYLARWAQLGYATTHTRAQSVTVDEALTVVDNSTRLPAAYVGLTRGRSSNWLHAVTDLDSPDPDAPTEHLELDDVLAGLLERRDQPTTAADLASAPQHTSAALHLHAVAHTPHDQPLPVPAGYAAAAAISAADPAARSEWHYEDQLQASWDNWLATIDQLGHPDDELFADPDHMWADPDAFEPTSAEIAELDLAAQSAYFTDQTPPQEHDMAPTTQTRPPQQPAKRGVNIEQLHNAIARVGFAEWIANRYSIALGRPGQTERRIECPIHTPGKPGAAAVYTSGDRHIMHCYSCNETHDAISLVERLDGVSRGEAIRGLAAELGVTGTVEYRPSPPTPPQPRVDLRVRLDRSQARTATDDDTRQVAALLAALDTPTERPAAHPAWAAAVLAYETAVAAGDGRAAHAAAAHIAALADPSTRDQLIDAGYWPAASSETVAARAGIIRSRWDSAADHIKALTAVRRRNRPAGERTAAADEHAWAAAVQHWLEDPAAAPLTRAWQELAASPPPPLTADPHLTVEIVAAAAMLPTSGAPLTLPVPKPSSHSSAARRSGPTPAGTDPRLDALTDTAAWYHHTLLTHPRAEPARRYLVDRGITPDQWARHRLGWAPDDWHATHSRLPDDIALAAGIANPTKQGARIGRPYDHLRGRVTFPITDSNGDTIAFAGRTLAEDDDTAKYMNTRNTDLYKKSANLFGLDLAADEIADTATAVIVEGYTDVIACHAAGLTNAVAACGTAVTAQHIDQLRNAGATRIVSLLDADPAGRKAADRLAVVAAERSMPTARAELPAGTDPADADPDQLHSALAAATPAALYLLETALDGHNPADAAPTADLVAAALEALDPGDDITRAVLTQTLTASLGPNWQRIAPAELTSGHGLETAGLGR